MSFKRCAGLKGKAGREDGTPFIGHNLKTYIADLEKQMREAAADLEFETAARLRDEIKRLEGLILDWHLNEEDAPSWVALVTEARRIRAAKGE